MRVEVVAAWDGKGCENALRRDLPGWVAKVKPRSVGWFPVGPAAGLATAMAKRSGWPPAGVVVSAISKDAPAVCMGFAAEVQGDEDAGEQGGRVVHAGDPLLTAHVEGSEKQWVGSRWVFSRKGGGHCDAAYAAAGAVHLARMLPPRRAGGRVMVIHA